MARPPASRTRVTLRSSLPLIAMNPPRASRMPDGAVGELAGFLCERGLGFVQRQEHSMSPALMPSVMDWRSCWGVALDIVAPWLRRILAAGLVARPSSLKRSRQWHGSSVVPRASTPAICQLPHLPISRLRGPPPHPDKLHLLPRPATLPMKLLIIFTAILEAAAGIILLRFHPWPPRSSWVCRWKPPDLGLWPGSAGPWRLSSRIPRCLLGSPKRAGAVPHAAISPHAHLRLRPRRHCHLRLHRRRWRDARNRPLARRGPPHRPRRLVRDVHAHPPIQPRPSQTATLKVSQSADLGGK